MATKKPGGGCRAAGRSKRKMAAKSKPLSLFVRGKISFEKYLSLTK